MVNSEIVSRVNQLMSEGFEIPTERLLPEATLMGDLGLDSLDAVDMLVILEEKLGTKIEGERLIKVRTLGDVYVLVEEAVVSSKDNTTENLVAQAQAKASETVH
jgi:acyl carrier protein